jgi:hypothetical protein
MKDFQQMVRERLRECELSPMREAEIADEMAQHQQMACFHPSSFTFLSDKDGRRVVYPASAQR